MCIKAAKAVGLEFAGVDLIREKMGHTYVTEVNGNPGTGIIDITGKNHFIDLVNYIDSKSEKRETIYEKSLSDENQQENEEEASLKSYQKLLSKQDTESLNYNESASKLFSKKFRSKV